MSANFLYIYKNIFLSVTPRMAVRYGTFSTVFANNVGLLSGVAIGYPAPWGKKYSCVVPPVNKNDRVWSENKCKSLEEANV